MAIVRMARGMHGKSTTIVLLLLVLMMLLIYDITLHNKGTVDMQMGYPFILDTNFGTGQDGMKHASPVYIHEQAARCEETFNKSLADNLEVVKNYPKGVAGEYLWKAGADFHIPLQMNSFPTIVTAIDSRFYAVSMGLFKSIHNHLMDYPANKDKVKFIVYDLGLTSRQAKMLMFNCRCEIRSFPFEQFPDHVRNLGNYAFKPIIMKITLMEAGFVWWVDSSVRFTQGDVDAAVKYTLREGMLFASHDDENNTLSITRQTDARTFQYLGEDRCKFRPFSEISATIILLRYNVRTNVIVTAWAACALNKDCIAPAGTLSKKHCDLTDARDGRCHRFDQSVLSILIRRVFHVQNAFPQGKILTNLTTIRRMEIVEYFEKCSGWTKCQV